MIAGQSLSLIGSTAVQFSVIWWLSTTLDSPIILALASIAAYIPNILLGPFVGVWIDRLNRKYVFCADGIDCRAVRCLLHIILFMKVLIYYMLCLPVCISKLILWDWVCRLTFMQNV